MPAMCVGHNLGAHARRAHLRVGVGVLGFALALGFGLVEFGVAERFGWLLAFPIAFGSYTLFAAFLGVCAFSSLLGQRHGDHGTEPVADCILRRQLMSKGIGLITASVAIALISASLFVGSV